MPPETSPATVHLRFHGSLRQFVTEARQTAGITAGTAVRDLVLRLGVPHDQIVYTMCLLNERRAPLDAAVADGDTLDIFQPVAGG